MITLLLLLIMLLIVANYFLIVYVNEPHTESITTENVKISVVIAAKNEFENIGPLFESLENLNYPPDDFEIIFVDDNSDDGTYELVENIALASDNITVIQADGKNLPGKKGALEIGISNARFDHIVITDADCQPEKEWLNSFSEKFNAGFDVAFGAAPYVMANGIINKISRFENLKSSILTFAFCNAGIPYSAAARSFGFTKEAFNSINGYENTTDTLSGDDDLLIREAVKKGLKIGCFTNEESYVYSETKYTFKDYLQQRARHTSTSNYYLLKHKLLLSCWHLLNLISLAAIPLAFFNIQLLLLPLVKIILDLVFCKSKQKLFGYRFNIFEIFYLQFFYELLLVGNYFLSFTKRNSW